jgi:hypothetical protein
MNTFNVELNDVAIQFRAETNPFECERVSVDVPLDAMDIKAIERILNGYTIIPCEDISSFKNLYYIVMALERFNIEYLGSFNMWATIDKTKLATMGEPEYIVFVAAQSRIISVSAMSEGFGDIFVSVLYYSIMMLDDIADPNVVIRTLAILDNLQFTNADMQTKYDMIKSKHSHKFLLTPFSKKFNDYFEYRTPDKITYSANGISRYPAMVRGDRVMVGIEEFADRWSEVSCGLFDKPQNVGEGDNDTPADAPPTPAPHPTFPWEGVYVAGGAISRILAIHFKNANNFDIDLFVTGKDRAERVARIASVLRWFEGANTYFAVMGSVVSVFVIGCPRIIQIISNDKLDICSVIGSFDSGHLQWAFNDEGVFGTAEAFKSFRHATTRVTNAGRFKPERFIKALYSGFNVVYDDENVAGTIMDLAHYIEDPANNHALKNIIAGFYKYWIPRDDPALDNHERDMYIKEEIKLHVLCSKVVRTTADVLIHITVGGNFETDYAATHFRSFDLSTINAKKIRPRCHNIVSDHRGTLRLTSELMTVKEVKNHAHELQIVCDNVIGGEFDDFMRVIDGVLCRQFIGRVPAKKIGGADTAVFNVDNGLIERQGERGVSILKNQHGEPLDIVNQLHVGDSIRVLFSITIKPVGWRGDDSGAVLNANRVVKYVADAFDDDDGNNDDDDDDDDNNNNADDVDNNADDVDNNADDDNDGDNNAECYLSDDSGGAGLISDEE